MRPRLIASAFFAFALSTALGMGQSNLASITGVVTDPTGAVIPGAAVTATNVETGVRSSVRTNEAGLYLLPSLPIGTYTLTVEQPGFSRYIREGITLSTGERLGLDVALKLGVTEAEVTISGETPLVEARTSDVNTLIEPKSIEALPLGNRRTLNIVALSGAAVFIGYPNTPSGSPSFSLAGGRGRSQMAWIDGGSAQNSRIGNPLVDGDPPAEAVAEVKVLANSYAAEFGASAGGVVMETTKSGTNQLHGSVYEYFRNDALDAAGFFAPIRNGQKIKPKLRYNVFGATAGGPIHKDKTFYFFSYEGQRLHNGSSVTLTVPTLLQREGDFSQTFNSSGQLIPIYDPATTTRLPNGTTTRQQFPNNVIPKNRLDPVALALLAYYPLPNRAPSNLAGANNFSGNSVSIIPSNFMMGKIDHNFSDKDRITGRYIRVSGTASIASVYPNAGAADPGPGSEFAERWAYRIYANWTHTVNSSQVNDFRFTYNDRLFHQLSSGLGGGYPSKLGLVGVPDTAFPAFSAAGFSSLGSTSQERVENPIRTEQFIDNYSWNRGRHQMKFGAEVRRSFHGDVQRNRVSGAFGFSTLGTGLPGNTSTGNGLATMLTGFVTSFDEVSTDHLFRHSYYLAAFAQDDWSVTRRLTLNLGLRWETDTPMIADDNHMNSFDPNQINPVSGTPGVVKFMGRTYPASPYATHWKNFGPRLGFAWNPFRSSKTVIRGGGGVFFAHPFDDSPGNAVALGFGTSASITTPDNGMTPAFYLRNGVPVAASTPKLDDSFGAVRVGTPTTTSVSFFDPHRAIGYSEQFNLGIQRELPGSMVLEVAGLGNLSRKLSNPNLSLNQIPPDILGPQHSSQRDRPFPQFTDVLIQFPTNGRSNYYAGMVRVEKRYSRGLSFGANYTWSKYLGNINEPGQALGNTVGSVIYSNYYNQKPNYGPTADDVAHRLNFHWIYELPFGAGRRWLANNPLRFIAGGWSIGNVSTLQTGPANTATTQTNNCNCFSAGPQRPNVVGNPNLPSDKRSVKAWFNTAAFAQPAAFTFGNGGIGIVRGPGLINVDFSVLRSFRITERTRAEFRAEFFNALNHTNLSNPGMALGSATFGVIGSAGPARQIELGARVVF